VKRLRAQVVFAALLAASISAAIGGYRRMREHARAPVVAAPPVVTLQEEAPTSTLTDASAQAPSPSSSPSPPSPSTTTAQEPAAPSRMFRGDRTRRHRSPFIGPTSPRVAFTYAMGGPIEAMPAMTPEGDLVVASLSGKITRLTKEGGEVWSQNLGERIYASPLIFGDAVLLGADDRRVRALALATGKPRWQLDVDGDADTGAAEAPDGTLVFAAGRVVYALRPNGSVRFRLKMPRKVYSSPAIADDGTIYVGAQDDHLYAIAPQGAIAWRRDLGADVDCAPTIGEDGLVYVGNDAGQVYAFDAKGALRWRAAVGGFVRGGLTVTRAGLVLAGTYGPAPRVVALDGQTGAERYSFRIQGTGAPEFGIHGAPLEDASGNLYFGAQDNHVYALDPSGRLRWSFATGGEIDAPLLLGLDGSLYIGSDDGRLVALR